MQKLYVGGVSFCWRHNESDGVSNRKYHDCLLNRLFRCRSKKTSKFRVTGFCAGNSPVTGEFPAQRSSDAENVSTSWRHHDNLHCTKECAPLWCVALYWIVVYNPRIYSITEYPALSYHEFYYMLLDFACLWSGKNPRTLAIFVGPANLANPCFYQFNG